MLRKTYICEDQVLDASGTVIKNLDFSDPIQAIIIGITGMFHDNNAENPDLTRHISKIEVVDGTDVLFSANGEQAQALQLNTTGKMPLLTLTDSWFYSHFSQIKLSFGRDDSDNEWALDPTKFTNPQIKITYAFKEGAGYWKDNEQKITIAVLVNEKAETRPTAFLMTKDIYSWPKASSGDETIDMPRDLKYRLLIMSTKDADTPTYAELTKIKISCDMDKFVPVNMTTEDLAHENANKTGMLFQQVERFGDGVDEDKKAYYPFAWNWGASIESWNFGNNVKVKRPYSGYITIRGAGAAHAAAVPADEAIPDGTRCLVTGRGYELHFTECLPFGNLRDPEEFLDPTPYKSVRLILTQAQTADIVSRILLQQLRPYA